jgi:hypothetical protein
VRACARFLLPLAAALVVAVDAQAQDVKVTLTDGSTVSAPLEALTDTQVVLRGKLQAYPRMDIIPGTERVIPLENVAIIERRGHGMRNAALIGIAAGVASSLVMSATIDSTEYEHTAALAILTGIGAGIGLGIGAVYDAVQRDGRLIYSAPSSGIVRLTPFITRERRGVRLAVAW